MEIDGARYPFDTEARIRINQFYKLDLIERLRMLKFAEETEKKFQDSKQTENTFALFTNEVTSKLNKLDNVMNIKENGDVDFTISGNLLLNGTNLKSGGTGDVTAAGNNVFTGTNTFGNINLRGQISFSNNPLFLFRYMNIDGATTSVFHLGNVNFPLNLLAKNNKIMLNGKEFGNSKFEIVFDGALVIDIGGELMGDMGIVKEYDYSQFVQSKDYDFIYFKIEDNINSEFDYMRNYNNDFCDILLCLKNKTVIKKIDYGNNSNFFVKIDDNSKKLYIAVQDSSLRIYIKNITIF